MSACASVPPPSPAARAELAPTGKLRAGINYGNFILAQKDPATGDSRGPAIDLARELGKRLGVPVEIVAYTAVGTMVDGAKAGAWDIAFLGSDPARAGEIDFTGLSRARGDVSRAPELAPAHHRGRRPGGRARGRAGPRQL